MVRENYLINMADSESTLIWAIVDTIRLAQKVKHPVIAYYREVGCLITEDTSINEGISRYRRNMKSASRERE